MSTPQEVAVMLALCAAHDPRFTTADEDQARARVVAWSDTLADVPGEYALGHVRRAYRSERTWPLQAGEIRDAWLIDQRRAESRQRAAQPRQEGVPMPDELRSFRDQLRRDREEREGVRSGDA